MESESSVFIIIIIKKYITTFLVFTDKNLYYSLAQQSPQCGLIAIMLLFLYYTLSSLELQDLEVSLKRILIPQFTDIPILICAVLSLGGFRRFLCLKQGFDQFLHLFLLKLWMDGFLTSIIFVLYPNKQHICSVLVNCFIPGFNSAPIQQDLQIQELDFSSCSSYCLGIAAHFGFVDLHFLLFNNRLWIIFVIGLDSE